MKHLVNPDKLTMTQYYVPIPLTTAKFEQPIAENTSHFMPNTFMFHQTL